MARNLTELEIDGLMEIVNDTIPADRFQIKKNEKSFIIQIPGSSYHSSILDRVMDYCRKSGLSYKPVYTPHWGLKFLGKFA